MAMAMTVVPRSHLLNGAWLVFQFDDSMATSPGHRGHPGHPALRAAMEITTFQHKVGLVGLVGNL